ncbi:MAG TPA: shikimate kinase [Micrococcaceae bacterium]|nr:shikimate kinase [Micrococcaceae bacterium]
MARVAAERPDFIPGRPIVLIGPMAVGKSAIGHHLAVALGLEFVDTDQLVVAKHGAIADIFASRGEGFFRLAEARSAAEVLERPGLKPYVLSLGGGAVLDSGTQQLLARATVVYLEADLETVRERINRNSGRPLLQGDPLERWRQLAEIRTPVYRRLADVTLDVRHGSIDALVTRLIDIIASARQPQSPEPPRAETQSPEPPREESQSPEPLRTDRRTAGNSQVLQNGTS